MGRKELCDGSNINQQLTHEHVRVTLLTSSEVIVTFVLTMETHNGSTGNRMICGGVPC